MHHSKHVFNVVKKSNTEKIMEDKIGKIRCVCLMETRKRYKVVFAFTQQAPQVV
jgi:hypothetical protein